MHAAGLALLTLAIAAAPSRKLVGDLWVPVDAEGRIVQPVDPPAAWELPPHRATLFLNFEGAMMSPGDNADLDQSECVTELMDWPAFAGSMQARQGILDVAQRLMQPYGIRVVDERPPGHLPYSMVMVGGTSSMIQAANLLGLTCSLDCGDRRWRETGFAFETRAAGDFTPLQIGTTVVHEAGHAFGFTHIDDDTRVMNTFIFDEEMTWATDCTPLDDTTGILCEDLHREFCPEGGQNTEAELLAFFGADSPDVTPPTIDILRPADGETFELGEPIVVEIEVTDDHEGVGWKLVLPESGDEVIAYGFETGWEVAYMSEGQYTIRIEALDHDRNASSAEVTVVVGDPEVGSTTDSPATTGSDPVGSTGNTDEDTARGDTGNDDGCSCTTAPSDRGTTGLLLLILLRRRVGRASPLCRRSPPRA